jgi:hypothetical protein
MAPSVAHACHVMDVPSAADCVVAGVAVTPTAKHAAARKHPTKALQQLNLPTRGMSFTERRTTAT